MPPEFNNSRDTRQRLAQFFRYECDEVRSDAVTLETTMLRKLNSVKHETVARAIGHDVSHVCRIASGERGIKLAEIEAFLRELGLSVIAAEDGVVSMPVEEAQALHTMALKGMRSMKLGG